MSEQDERVREIEERARKATPGPWELHDWTDDADTNPITLTAYKPIVGKNLFPEMWAKGKPVWIADLGDDVDEPDRQFLMHAREDIPYLVAAVRDLQRQLKELEAINKAANDWADSRLGILGKETSPSFADKQLLEAILGGPAPDTDEDDLPMGDR